MLFRKRADPAEPAAAIALEAPEPNDVISKPPEIAAYDDGDVINEQYRKLNGCGGRVQSLGSKLIESNSPPDYDTIVGCNDGVDDVIVRSRDPEAVGQEIPDGGWGWVIVGASFFAHMIADGCGFSFGVLFGELLEVFKESKSRTAWVGSLFVSIPAVCGPIAGALTTRYGCRNTTMAGGLIAGLGCLASAYVTSIDQLCLTFGIISGFGLSLVLVPSVIVVAFNFEKKRALATGRLYTTTWFILLVHVIFSFSANIN